MNYCSIQKYIDRDLEWERQTFLLHILEQDSISMSKFLKLFDTKDKSIVINYLVQHEERLKLTQGR
jgi:hypothetical protein